LEGALIRVTAFASLSSQDVDIRLAEMVLKDLIGESERPEITAAIIMGVTAEYFGLTLDDLTGGSRSRVLTTARQIAMYLCRELTELSLPKIGPDVRRPRPHHGHARRPQDPSPDGRAGCRSSTGRRADQPDQGSSPRLTLWPPSTAVGEAVHVTVALTHSCAGVIRALVRTPKSHRPDSGRATRVHSSTRPMGPVTARVDDAVHSFHIGEDEDEEITSR
jgi:hypothetical protein